MQLAFTVESIVIAVTVVIAVLGILIDRATRGPADSSSINKGGRA